MTGAVDRARADLAAGRVRVARERLKSSIAARPYDVTARALLAEAYRRDRQAPEAGRWGFLIDAAATDNERTAFLAHVMYPRDTRLSRARLRWLLRCDDLNRIADASGVDRMREITAGRITRGLRAIICGVASRRRA